MDPNSNPDQVKDFIYKQKCISFVIIARSISYCIPGILSIPFAIYAAINAEWGCFAICVAIFVVVIACLVLNNKLYHAVRELNYCIIWFIPFGLGLPGVVVIEIASLVYVIMNYCTPLIVIWILNFVCTSALLSVWFWFLIAYMKVAKVLQG